MTTEAHINTKETEMVLPASKQLPEVIDSIVKTQMHGNQNGENSYFFNLDYLNCGFHRGELSLIAGTPECGRSSLALCMALNFALKQEYSVLFCTTEYTAQQAWLRLLATRAKISLNTLRSGIPLMTKEEWQELDKAQSELEKSKLMIHDAAGWDILSLSLLAAGLRRPNSDPENGLDIMLVDDLQSVISGPGGQRNTAGQVWALKKLARELQIPVLSFLRLANTGPGLSEAENEDFCRRQYQEQIGCADREVDTLIFMQRPELLKPGLRPGEVDLIVAKQRHGSSGRTTLGFIDKYVKFANLEEKKRGKNKLI